MKCFFYIILFSILFACGGGAANSKDLPTYEPDPIMGLQGDINAIEPIDLD